MLQRFRRGNPERALAYGSAALLLLTAAIVVFAIRDARQVARVLEDIRSTKRPIAEAAYEIEINAFELGATAMAFIIRGDTQSAALFRSNQRQLRGVVRRYATLSAPDAESARVASLRALVARYDSTAQRLVDLRASTGRAPPDADLASFGELQRQLDVLLDQHVQPHAIDRWHAAADDARLGPLGRRRSSWCWLPWCCSWA